MRALQQALHQASVSSSCCSAPRDTRLTVPAESALKRHGYYCQSNKKAPIPRRRSCTACAQAKIGCNHALPACPRCAQKGFACQYPSTKRRDAVGKRHAVSNGLHHFHEDSANMIISAVAEQTQSPPNMTPASDGPVLFTDVQWNFDDMTVFDEFMHPAPQLTSPSTASSSSPASNALTTVSPPSLLPDTTIMGFQEQSQLDSE